MKWSQLSGIRAFILASIFLIANIVWGQSAWPVVERGLDYTVLQKTTVQNGTNCTHKIHVLATGLNYTNPVTGQLTESCEQIVIQPDGSAVANQGRHSVKFPADIYDGVFQVTTPDGRNLFSRPLCVCYDDGSNTVVIATLTNSIGCLAASNQITYHDCFSGVHADIVATYRRSGFECDLVFHSRPDEPNAYGLSDANSTIELVTEFFNTQDPQQIPAGRDDWFGLQDDTLKFGKLSMTHGKAFAFNNNTNSQASTPVYKSWIHTDDGRRFLVEQVPLVHVAEGLNGLPLTASIETKMIGVWHLASARPQFPAGHGILADTNHILLAALDLKPAQGVVLDYVEQIDGSLGDITFTPDTWFVAGLVDCGNVTIQGGAIFKYPNNTIASIEIDGSLTCPATADPPAFFTAGDDDSLGDSLSGVWSGYSGALQTTEDYYLESYYDQQEYGYQYGSPALILTSSANLNNLRFNYAAAAIWVYDEGYNSFNFTNLQFNSCDTTVILDAYDYHNGNDNNDGGHSLSFGNCLVANVPLVGNDPADDSWNFENCTFDDATLVNIYAQNGKGNPPQFGYFYGNLNFVNCIFSDISTDSSSFAGGNNGFYDDGSYDQYLVFWMNPFGENSVTTSEFPFISASAANYYLASGCPFYNAGTTSIDPNLLAQLQTMTTYAPQDGGQVDSSGTDLGYHYSVNEDSDYDGIPDSWIWKYFDNYSHHASDLDSSGNTLLYDYQHSLDPNVIAFSISTANNYVSSSTPTLEVSVIVGFPAYYAVLVDDSNLGDAVWQPYTGSSITVNLGSTQGSHDVRVGLRGPASNATATWEETTLVLDSTSPTISITSPANNVSLNTTRVNVGGSCSGANLKQITVNGMPAFINSGSYEAVNVPLVTGANTITAIATDYAGNTATVTLTITGASTLVDPVQLSATPTAGFTPLAIGFTATANVPRDHPASFLRFQWRQHQRSNRRRPHPNHLYLLVRRGIFPGRDGPNHCWPFLQFRRMELNRSKPYANQGSGAAGCTEYNRRDRPSGFKMRCLR